MYVLLKLALTDIFCVKFLLAFTIDHLKYIGLSCTAWTYNDRYEVVHRLPACILCIASPLYVYIDFVKYVCNFFCRFVSLCKINLLLKKKTNIVSCINFQLPIVIFKKSIYSDMHHRITYIHTYI